MTPRSVNEASDDYISTMGLEFGRSFFALHRKLIELHILWLQYRQLFGSDPQTVDLLNRTAGLFFKIVQDELWDSVLLGISRMTDPAETGRRKNLTIFSLLELISDITLRNEIKTLCDDALNEAKFAREHRNKRIAHQDNCYTDDSAANALSGVSRERVEAMLASLRSVLNRLNAHYFDSTTMYEMFVDDTGASLLVHKLHKFERLAVSTSAM